jgi:hypothetical protein
MIKSSSQDKLQCIEVEQKFCTSNLAQVQSKLTQMGFKANTSTVQFMDWYFDLPSLPLCTQDFWLRYRHPSDISQGSWQLKRGKRISNGNLSGSSATRTSTVYEELEGDDALDVVESLLIEKSIQIEPAANGGESCGKMDGFLVPELPRLGKYGIQPFARIETIRSSWKSDDTSADQAYKGITVDLDGTDYGYTVGEVELVVQTNDEIDKARDRVQVVIQEITGNGSSRALGKLETYLIENKPEVYDACVKAGSMRDS